MKAITPVIAIILLMIITISMVGFAFMWFNRTVTSTTESLSNQTETFVEQSGGSFSIEGVDKNVVYIRNRGTTDIKNLGFYTDNKRIRAAEHTIKPNTVGTVYLNDADLAMAGGISEIKVSSALYSDKIKEDPYAQYTIAYWKFDGDTKDSSGGNDGVFVGETMNDGMISGSTSTEGKYGNGMSFDGVDDYVNVPHSTTLEPSLLTIEAWIYPKSTDNQGIVRKNGDYAFSIYDGKIQGAVAASWGLYDSGFAPSINTWQHVAVTYDGSKLRFYRNGLLGNTFDQAGSANAVESVDSTKIGFDDNGWYFSGLIDEVRIYNKALTENEIKADMASSYPIDRTLGYWSFNDNTISGNTAKDTHYLVAGAKGGAVSFDGVDDYVSIPYDTSSPVFNLDTKFTYSVGVKPSDIMPLIQRELCGSTYPINDLWLDGSAPNFNIQLRLNSANNDGYETFTANNVIPRNQWSQVVVTYDKNAANPNVNIYVNGNKVFSGIYSNILGKPNTPLWIGGIPHPSGCQQAYGNGIIDDVRILNVARTMGDK